MHVAHVNHYHSIQFQTQLQFQDCQATPTFYVAKNDTDNLLSYGTAIALKLINMVCSIHPTHLDLILQPHTIYVASCLFPVLVFLFLSHGL